MEKRRLKTTRNKILENAVLKARVNYLENKTKELERYLSLQRLYYHQKSFKETLQKDTIV